MQLFELVEMFEGADDNKNDLDIGLGDIRAWFKESERLRLEIAELKHTRSEAEAAAKVRGFREGQQDIVRQLRGQSINLNLSYNPSL